MQRNKAALLIVFFCISIFVHAQQAKSKFLQHVDELVAEYQKLQTNNSALLQKNKQLQSRIKYLQHIVDTLLKQQLAEIEQQLIVCQKQLNNWEFAKVAAQLKPQISKWQTLQSLFPNESKISTIVFLYKDALNLQVFRELLDKEISKLIATRRIVVLRCKDKRILRGIIIKYKQQYLILHLQKTFINIRLRDISPSTLGKMIERSVYNQQAYTALASFYYFTKEARLCAKICRRARKVGIKIEGIDKYREWSRKELRK